MKFRITLKDPDGVYEGLREAAFQHAQSKLVPGTLTPTDSEWSAVMDAGQSTVDNFARTWVEYGEYVVLEFDTKANTVRVVPVDEVNNG